MNQKIQHKHRNYRRNMAIPVVLVLMMLAGVGIALVSCRSEAPRGEELSQGISQSRPEDSSREEPESEPEQEPEPEKPDSSGESTPEQEAPVPEPDGSEIAIPASEAWEPYRHLFLSEADDFRLVLVNKEYTMPDEFPDLPVKEIGDYRVHEGMYDALTAMMEAAREEGLPLVIVSGYRPISRSKLLYENKVQEYVNAGYSQEDAAVEAGMWIAPPGTSEHATGLAVDLVSADYYTRLPDLLPEFEEFEEAKWLKAHCAEYGFILRFPEGKEDITQVVYEPWHFRYVGEQAAAEIMERGITLEEYLGAA